MKNKFINKEAESETQGIKSVLKKICKSIITALMDTKYPLLAIIAVHIIDYLVPFPVKAAEWSAYGASTIILSLAYVLVLIIGMVVKMSVAIFKNGPELENILFYAITSVARISAWASVFLFLPIILLRSVADSAYQIYQEHPEILISLFFGSLLCAICVLAGIVYLMGKRTTYMIFPQSVPEKKPVETPPQVNIIMFFGSK